ncbi:hypothetical protein DBV15_08829 [Temnothorax longispinosus]|uniref:Ig-like domain-containing protein n=1 Tax=Temnothorax longispinosus TaxID=300112 RepID=A0A4S2JBU8_9HYME|nr:hypothetical protein DBV15_08829 [Temnothorax longispinosus]
MLLLSLPVETVYKDNRAYPWPGGESHFILYPESANQTIYTQEMRASDAGRYSCQARNDTTTLEGDITLSVLVPGSQSLFQRVFSVTARQAGPLKVLYYRATSSFMTSELHFPTGDTNHLFREWSSNFWDLNRKVREAEE